MAAERRIVWREVAGVDFLQCARDGAVQHPAMQVREPRVGGVPDAVMREVEALVHGVQQAPLDQFGDALGGLGRLQVCCAGEQL